MASYDKVFNPRILEIIIETPKLNDGWGSIDVLRMSCGTEKPVTISITVDWTLDPIDWAGAEQKIKALLDEHGFSDVEVEFERGDGPEGY